MSLFKCSPDIQSLDDEYHLFVQMQSQTVTIGFTEQYFELQ